jgi:membrane-associated protein
MEAIFDSFQHILDPNWIMHKGGLYLVLAILFIETAFFFGFFLPGDPLLFVSGMLIASAKEVSKPFDNALGNLFFWMGLFTLATLIGYYVGYWFGGKFGNRLSNRKDGWIFKKKYIQSAEDFYHQKGGFAIAIARFLPFVRTFAPIIAGMVKMDFRKFSFYNIIGSILWVFGITSLGYALGGNKWVNDNLEYVLLLLVIVVSVPVFSKMLFKQRNKG